MVETYTRQGRRRGNGSGGDIVDDRKKRSSYGRQDDDGRGRGGGGQYDQRGQEGIAYRTRSRSRSRSDKGRTYQREQHSPVRHYDSPSIAFKDNSSEKLYLSTSSSMSLSQRFRQFNSADSDKVKITMGKKNTTPRRVNIPTGKLRQDGADHGPASRPTDTTSSIIKIGNTRQPVEQGNKAKTSKKKVTSIFDRVEQGNKAKTSKKKDTSIFDRIKAPLNESSDRLKAPLSKRLSQPGVNNATSIQSAAHIVVVPQRRGQGSRGRRTNKGVAKKYRMTTR